MVADINEHIKTRDGERSNRVNKLSIAEIPQVNPLNSTPLHESDQCSYSSVCSLPPFYMIICTLLMGLRDALIHSSRNQHCSEEKKYPRKKYWAINFRLLTLKHPLFSLTLLGIAYVVCTVLESTRHVFQRFMANLNFIYPSLRDVCKQSMRMNKHYLISALLSAVELSQVHHGSVQFSSVQLGCTMCSWANLKSWVERMSILNIWPTFMKWGWTNLKSTNLQNYYPG